MSELLNKSNKTGGYKINAQNTVSLVYTNSELTEKESMSNLMCMATQN